MSRGHPLATLLTGGALGAGLLIASMAATPEEPAADDEAVPVVTDSPEPDEPDPTVEPEPEEIPDDDVTDPEPDDTDEQTTPPGEAPEPVTYVGYVDGGGASVAVIVDGDEAIAYVCDGQSREAWLSGVVVDSQLELTGDRGTLSASYDDSIVEGETTVDGQTWTFRITQVDPPEGLYQFADTVAGGAEVVGGWIVLPDGSQVGAVNVDGQTQPAEPLDVTSGEVTVEGEVVTAELQGRDIDE